MTAVRVGTRGFMYRYKVPLSELQWVDTRRFRRTMRKIYGNGDGILFSNVQRTAPVEFYLHFNPRLFFSPLRPRHYAQRNALFSRQRVFNPILLSSLSLSLSFLRHTFKSHHVFFFFHRLYFYLSKNSRQ